MVTVVDKLTKDEVETYALVLFSQGIVHQALRQADGWELRVAAERSAEAQTLIRAYRAENPTEAAANSDTYSGFGKSLAGIWGALPLAAVHVAVVLYGGRPFMLDSYAATAGRMLNGEWYRAATALLLHADVLHLAGNMVGIAILGSAVCSIMGWGVGWLMILCSGIAGNVINAVVYKAGHSSIGASTAVFGALGILSAWQFQRRLRLPGHRLRALVPLGAGLALLGFMGSSAHTDILAHLFGFLAGLVIGVLYSATVRERFKTTVQAAALAATAVILSRAFMGSG